MDNIGDLLQLLDVKVRDANFEDGAYPAVVEILLEKLMPNGQLLPWTYQSWKSFSRVVPLKKQVQLVSPLYTLVVDSLV